MQLARVFWSFIGVLVIALLVAIGSGFAGKTSLGAALIAHLTKNFRDETAQTRFMSYATKITPLSRLEVAKLEQVEMFERTSDATVFWNYLKLPQVVVRATLPVEYRYYVEFTDRWNVELKDHVLTVMAPVLDAGTPSANISELQYDVRKGSLFRSETSVAEALRLELTSLLAKRAQENISLVRETARLQISEFATKWLSSESNHAKVVVRFADELPHLEKN